MNLGAAVIALILAGFVKLLVLGLAARLCFRLVQAVRAKPGDSPWLTIVEEDRREVVLLAWSLGCFFFAEVACGIELYILLRADPLTSIFHSFASAGGMALFAIALWRYFDRKMFHYGGSACLLNRACRGCTFGASAGCKYRSVLWYVALFIVMACVPPLFASTGPMVAEPARWALPFPSLNAWYDTVYLPWLASVWPGLDPAGGGYVILESVNQVEYRWIPVAGLVIAVLGAVMVRLGREARGIEVSLAALGVAAYSYLDLITFRLSGDALAGGVMQEVAELWFVLFCAELLQRSFGAPASTPSSRDGDFSSQRLASASNSPT